MLRRELINRNRINGDEKTLKNEQSIVQMFAMIRYQKKTYQLQSPTSSEQTSERKLITKGITFFLFVKLIEDFIISIIFLVF